MPEKKSAKTNTQKFNSITDQLPDFTHQYFYSGTSGKAILTRISYALDIKYFLEFAVNYYPYFTDKQVKELSIEDIRQIKATDIDDFLTWMDENQHLSERTRARRRSSISGIFEYLINTERKLDYNPVAGSLSVEIPENEYVIYLNIDEQEQLLNCIRYGTGLTQRQLIFHEKYKKRDLAIVFLFLDTGLRISELQALNVNDVIIYEDLIDPEKNECYVLALRKGKKKSGTTSKVYFSDESKEYITEYLDSRKVLGEKFTENTPLFTTNTGDRLSIREIQQMLKKYVAASLKRTDISVHKLRSSFAMEFYKHEKNILVLQQRMGHRSINATNIYARASDREEAVKNSRNWRNNK
ncbi:tyrosine-type recombinase/integrase [Butyrivibrio sp. YAB3001]|uniref:tyrosine-type recombinase/integrase n=1 Tax=Butyrivibrio sp. YAB3001 TaxID=1520812 RepID=UPI0008F62B79|nr:tyrosine-type recombinase/integrase [Butyrivibrio sp. YAB3001]SFC47551.1 Phage integrase, N-terminal SAM-like domain [Butyrivibrio sp. YAB3001]